MRCFIHVFVAMVVLCSGLMLHAQDGSLTLRETLEMLNEDLERVSGDPVEYPKAVRYWIDVLEQAIPTGKNDDVKNTAVYELASLYIKDNQNTRALEVLDQLLSFSTSHVRQIQGALDAAGLAAALGESTSRIIGYTNTFLDLVDTYRGTGVYFPIDSYDDEYHDIDLIRSKMLWNSAQIISKRLLNSALQATSKAAPVYILSTEYLKPFIETKIDRGEIYDVFEGATRLFQDLAEIYIELAELYDRSGDTDQMQQARLDAIEAYESILNRFPDIITVNPNLTSAAGVAILEQKILLGIDLDKIVDDAYEISELVAPQSGFAGDLALIAGDIRNRYQEDPKGTHAAYLLFTLSMDLNTKRLPDTYKTIFTYQFAAVSAIDCTLEMGEYAQAKDLLDHIDTIGDLSKTPNIMLKGVRKEYEKQTSDVANTSIATSVPTQTDITTVGNTTAQNKHIAPQQYEANIEHKPVISIDTTNNQNTSVTQNSSYLYIGSIVGILILVGCGIVIYRRI